MKKLTFIPLVLIFTLVLSNVMPISGYSVTVGTILEYDNVQTVWDFSMNASQSSGTGFSFDGKHFPNDTLVSVEVDAATSSE
ncbi:MAG: hypothetical protein ACTSPT_05340, partial [Candidatus Heimdallarchaeota archaeon]